MKNVILSVFFALLIVACVAKEVKDKKENSCKESSECVKEKASCSGCNHDEKEAINSIADTSSVAVSVDTLLANPEKTIDQKK